MLVGKKIQKEKKETKQEGIKVKNTKKMWKIFKETNNSENMNETLY
jgi:hypothetical protein